MSNRSDGNRFERELCVALSVNGFWVHNFAQNAAGQPADVIAVKNGKAYLIDCKVCKNDVFLFSRIEYNQELAMRKWREAHNGSGWFALELSDGLVYMLHLSDFTSDYKQLNREEIERYCTPLAKWVLEVNKLWS